MCNMVSRSLGREGVVRCSSSWLAGVATANYMCTTCPLDIFAQVMRGGRRIKVRAVVVSFEYSANGVNCARARGAPGPALLWGDRRTGSFAYTVSRSRKDGAILQMGQLINPDNGKAVTPHTANSDEWGF